MWALERAKQNVLENYLLVGILEELEDVLLLLERLLPHYFTGVLSIYKSPGTYCMLLVIWEKRRVKGCREASLFHLTVITIVWTKMLLRRWKP